MAGIPRCSTGAAQRLGETMNIAEVIKNAAGNPTSGSVASILPVIIKAVEDALAGERKAAAPVAAPKPADEKRVVEAAEKR